MRPVPVAPGQTLHAVPPSPADELLTISALSVKLGQPEHLVRKGVRMGLVPLGRAGRVGFVRAADLELIRSALADAGLIPAPAPIPLPSISLTT